MVAVSQPATFYISSGATLYFFGNTDIYGDVVNNGNLGTFGGNTVTFYGTNWTNSSTATFPIGSGTGANFQFVQPRPSPFINNAIQNLDGGYVSGTQPSFPHLEINNANNVNFINTNTRVAGVLNFVSGDIVLNAKDLVLGSPAGNGGTGTITNYNQNNFVITNTSAGHLVKESYTGVFTYPVGINATDYTPAAITNNTLNGLHVNVSNYASSAAPRVGTTGIDRTWNIYADSANGSSVIDLENNNSSNQLNFRPAAQFVTRYVGTAPNTAGDLPSTDAWENNTPGAGTSTGTLTTGAAIANASEKTRTYSSFATTATANSAYYTKSSPALLCINVRAYLEGALMNNASAVALDGRPLMRDNLRSSPFNGTNYLPSADPYETATTHVNVVSKYTKLPPQTTHPEFQQVTDTNVFKVTGQNAIVDWAFVELRSKSNSATVQATRAALIQRDGDIVDVDGVSCLSFPGVAIDSYYVAVRHRSHLGVMTKYGQSGANLQALVDLSLQSTPVFDFGTTLGSFDYTGLATNNSVKTGYRAMWQGDFNADKKIKFDNPSGDDNVLLFDVLNDPGNTNHFTNYNFAFGYYQGDYNMDSKEKYDNPSGDDNLLLFQAINYPQNTSHFTNFNFMLQQLP